MVAGVCGEMYLFSVDFNSKGYRLEFLYRMQTLAHFVAIISCGACCLSHLLRVPKRHNADRVAMSNLFNFAWEGLPNACRKLLVSGRW